MSDIKVFGGTKLSGQIKPSGNKNSVLPCLCATLLTSETVILENVPEIIDVRKLVDQLRQLGSVVDWDLDSRELRVDNEKVSLTEFDNSLPLGMRASLLVIAPLLARFQRIVIDPRIGGCTLGIREIDPHVEMLRSLGAQTERKGGGLTLEAPGGLHGAHLWPDYQSVTATENVIMAAVLAEGITEMYNAACEPHVQDLCRMLQSMGANIKGIGTNRLVIEGVSSLKGARFRISADHHEITTFLALGAMTGGRVEVVDALPEHFPLIVRQFRKLGVEIGYEGDTAVVDEGQSFEPLQSFTENYIPQIQAAPWPYFQVDLLPLMVSLSLKTKGPIRFWNKVYEGGLFWVTELVKMGAKIEISDPHRIIVLGPAKLKGAEIDCPYIIRATIALMMAAMVAEGDSVLHNIDTIYRAHPHFLDNLQRLGGRIEKL